MSKNIITCTDDFQWKIVTATEAKAIFNSNHEVFALDDDNVEALVDDVADFDLPNLRFAIELGFKKKVAK